MLAPKKTTTRRVLDRYELIEIIGRGGMGRVYRAKDIRLQREVALKTIRDTPTPTALELFQKECNVLASLSHPNIVEIFDIGEFEDDDELKPYFVMPLLSGATLDQLIQGGGRRLAVERSLEIIFQTCRGLHAAHEKEIVHRDLKPSNIFVLQDDSVKIIDFGVAHMVDSRNSVSIRGGTARYMAPEQVLFQPVSRRSDLFSLGVILFEALTGSRPFDGRTDAEIAEAIKSYSPPPASELSPEVSESVSRVLQKALSKQPNYRFATVKEFAETLQKAHRNEPIEFFDPIRIQPRIQRAKKAIEQCNYQFASEILDELAAEGQTDPTIPSLRRQIERGEHQKAIQQLLDDARIRLEGGEFLLAEAKIEKLLSLDPGNLAALTLKEDLEALRNEHRIDEWLLQARQHLVNDDFSRARSAIQKIVQLKPEDARALQMLSEVDDHEQERLGLHKEKEQSYKSAMDAWQRGNMSAALSSLDRLMDLERQSPDTSSPQRAISVQALYAQVRSDDEAMRSSCEEVRKRLSDRNYSIAVAICNKYLIKYPGHELFEALKREVGERQSQDLSERIAEIEQRVEAEPGLDAKINVLRGALEAYPGEARLERSLGIIRNKRGLVNSLVAKARGHENRREFNEALEQWESLRSVYRQYPSLDFEVERLTRLREEDSRAESKRCWIELIDRQLDSGDSSKALTVAQDALTEFPEAVEVRSRAELARIRGERAVEAQRLAALGRELCSQNRLEEGLANLRQALQTDEQDIALRRELLESLLNQAQEALETNLALSQALVELVLRSEPADVRASSLQTVIRDRQQEEFVTRRIAGARKLQAGGDLAGALNEIARGLSQHADDPRLRGIESELRSVLQQSLEASDVRRKAEIAERVNQSQRRENLGDLPGAIAEAEQSLATYPDDPQLQDLAAKLRKSVQDLRKREDAVLRCISTAQRMQIAGDLPAALSHLQGVLTVYPNEGSLEQLKADLIEALDESQRQREESVLSCLTQAQHRQAVEDLEGALAQIEQGLSCYPEEPRLRDLAARLSKCIQEQLRRREDSVARCIINARKLQDAGDLSAALEHVRSGLTEYPGETRLERAKADLEKALKEAERRREEFLVSCLSKARERQGAGDLDGALVQVSQGLLRYPGEPRLQEVESVLQNEQEEARRRREESINGVLKDIGQCEAAGDLQGALARVDQELTVYRDDARLVQVRAAVLRGIEDLRRKKEEHVSRCLNNVRELHEANDLDGAMAQVEHGLASYPEDPRLRRLHAVLRAAVDESRSKKEDLIARSVAHARQLMSKGDLRSALIEIENTLSIYSGDPGLAEVHALLIDRLEAARRKREQSVEGCITEARRLHTTGDMNGAIAEIKEGLSISPGDERLTKLLSALQNVGQSRNQGRWPLIVGFAVILLGFPGYMLYRSHRTRASMLARVEIPISAPKRDPNVEPRQPPIAPQPNGGDEPTLRGMSGQPPRDAQPSQVTKPQFVPGGLSLDGRETTPKRDGAQDGAAPNVLPSSAALPAATANDTEPPAAVAPKFTPQAYCRDMPDATLPALARMHGVLSWDAGPSGEAGTIVICRGHKATFGRVGGQDLPGVPVTIAPLRGVHIGEYPSPANHFSWFTFQTDGTIHHIDFSWELDAQK